LQLRLTGGDTEREGEEIMRPDTSRVRDDNTLILDNAGRDAKTAADYRGLCETLCEEIAEDRLPPDEAYWWTRIALAEAAALLDQAAA